MNFIYEGSSVYHMPRDAGSRKTFYNVSASLRSVGEGWTLAKLVCFWVVSVWESSQIGCFGWRQEGEHYQSFAAIWIHIGLWQTRRYFVRRFSPPANLGCKSSTYHFAATVILLELTLLDVDIYPGRWAEDCWGPRWSGGPLSQKFERGSYYSQQVN